MSEAPDRVLVLTRHLRAPIGVVWRAWTDPTMLPRWFGPKGTTCQTERIDLNPGGEWVFDMLAPDGTVFPNRHRITGHEPPHRLTYLLDDGTDARPPVQVEVVLTPAGEGTDLRLTMTFPDAEGRAIAERYGAVGLGYETLEKLARRVEG